MARTKQTKLGDINFNSYTSFPETVTITNDNDVSEFEIYKDGAIELINHLTEHFDINIPQIDYDKE